MNIAQIGQPYNTGLGHIAWGFEEQFHFHKNLLVERKGLTPFPERFVEVEELHL